MTERRLKMDKKFWNGVFWGMIISSLLWIGVVYLLIEVGENIGGLVYG
jgi:hypothetical protein